MNMGVLRKLRGLIVGRPMRYTEAEKQQFREVILERTRWCTFPLVADVLTIPPFAPIIGAV